MSADFGPGKYDDLCTYVMQQASAQGAAVFVFGGNKGDGYDVHLRVSRPQTLAAFLKLAECLRTAAADIERQVFIDSSFGGPDTEKE